MSYNKMMILTLRAKRNQIKSIILICQYILYICIYFKQMSFSVKLFAPCKLACPCCCWHARQQDKLCLPQQLTYSWQGKIAKTNHLQMSTTGKRTHSFPTTGLSYPPSRNLSPLPGGIPAKFRNIWFSLTQTSCLRSETIYLGKSLNFSRESKPNQSRSTQKEDINVHLPKK
jgi:hypothetical protein